ncbi:MAG: SusC/RagA family TonB-linked outer membrane protein [Tannerella sp.]|jgi:TonB-linked SusC/RagA family outer membrane protein|nr:SusC/RagA family TonB-linked outer membrane protein [Tannerella sp.]
MSTGKFLNTICIVAVWLCNVLGIGVSAQEKGAFKLQGTVINDYGKPVEGALLSTENGNTYVTARDGAYTLTADGSDIVVSAKGYRNKRIATADIAESNNIKLEFDPHHTGGFVDIGYFSLPKESFPGSAVSVTGEELDKMPTNVFSETFAGRLLGLHTKQDITELTFFGYSNVSKMIRGRNSYNGSSPIIIIDGIICPNQYWEFLSPKEVESVTVLKDGATNAIYGIQGASGAIVITTKRGYTGKKKVEAYSDFSFQEMTKRPTFVNSLQYVELRNQAGLNDGLGAFSQFSESEVEGFRTGDAMYYPNNNWYDMFVKKMVARQRAGVNVSGGNEKLRYFSNISYLHQEEPIKIASEPDRKYDPNPDVNVVNFRSNFDVKLNNYLEGFMRLTGNVKREMFAGTSENRTHYSRILNLPPTMYGPLTPVFEDYSEASEQVVTTDATNDPAYGSINRSGFSQVIETNVIAQAGLNFDMSFLVKGLSANGSMAYQTYIRNTTSASQSYERWIRSNDFGYLEFSKKGSAENTPLSQGKGSVFFYHLNLLGQLNYNRRFDQHSINAMAYIFYQQQEKEVTSGSGILPYKRQSTGISATYGYLDKYFLKGDLGYSGSEQFSPEHRYIATPAVSASWIVSKEDFLAGAADALSLLKLRVSYAAGANDQLGGNRFLYLDYIDSGGNEGLKGNPDLSAEKIKMQNYGIELGLFHSVSLSFDYFHHRTDNMLIGIGSTVPVYQGIPLGYYPKLNNGKMENKGFEIEFNYDKQLTQDLSVFATAGFSQAVNKVIKINESPYAEDYPYRYHTEGYSVGQPWGLLINRNNGNGIFNSAEELAGYDLTYSHGTPRVGDFIYSDLNNDGMIDEKDYAPLGYPSFPQQYFNFSGGFNYKNFEVNVLFQGVNQTSFFLSGIGAYEYQSQGIFNDIHLQAWTPERYAAGEEITFPALSLSQSTNHISNSYFLQNGAYLRLKNAEIAYTLPESIARKIAAEKIRIMLTGLNLLTFDKLRTKHVDPEIRNMNAFQPYRVYNIGISLTF